MIYHYDRNGKHYIVETGRDNRGNYASVYYLNLLGQPIVTKSQKEGLFAQRAYISAIMLADAMELADFHFPNNVVKL